MAFISYRTSNCGFSLYIDKGWKKTTLSLGKQNSKMKFYMALGCSTEIQWTHKKNLLLCTWLLFSFLAYTRRGMYMAYITS